KPPPQVTDCNVIMVDFSYKRAVLENMARTVNSILILDHHKTAAEDLAGLPPLPGFPTWREAAWNGKLSQSIRMSALFDMDRSGAALAWDYFCGNVARKVHYGPSGRP